MTPWSILLLLLSVVYLHRFFPILSTYFKLMHEYMHFVEEISKFGGAIKCIWYRYAVGFCFLFFRLLPKYIYLCAIINRKYAAFKACCDMLPECLPWPVTIDVWLPTSGDKLCSNSEMWFEWENISIKHYRQLCAQIPFVSPQQLDRCSLTSDLNWTTSPNQPTDLQHNN